MRRLLVAAAALLAATAAHAEGPPAGTGYTDLSGAFVAFYDANEGLDIDARVAAFKRDVAPLYPAFYAPRDGRTQDQVDANIRKAIEEFPSIRDKYVAAEQAFPVALAKAREHFHKTFPNSTASLPTYLLHSLGEMDGGTRTVDGRDVMVFGADGIAKYHSPTDIGAFFDHEFLHVEHGSYFKDCDAIWCSLWEEGLATATAGQMNPGIGDAALMLTIPRPIAPEVDAHWRAALCYLDARKDSVTRDDYKALFWGNGGTEILPPRWGYYVGYKVAQDLLKSHSLVELAHMPNDGAETLVKGQLAKMVAAAGGCVAKR
jgi:hypothetical protein